METRGRCIGRHVAVRVCPLSTNSSRRVPRVGLAWLGQWLLPRTTGSWVWLVLERSVGPPPPRFGAVDVQQVLGNRNTLRIDQASRGPDFFVEPIGAFPVLVFRRRPLCSEKALQWFKRR